MNLLIKNCRLISEGREVIKNIYISDGKIADITDKPKNIDYDRVIDAKENFVIPGLIDPHVHFRDPGLTQKEDFYTGSCAAAAGGITTFFDMPNTKPPTFTYFELEGKRLLAKKSIVNYGFYIGASKDNNIAEIRQANQHGNVPGTKLFMNLSTGELMIEDKKLIEEIFKSSRIVATHAEGEKVEEAIRYAIKTRTQLYLCHISTAAEIDVIKKYRAKNPWAKENIFVEVTPHHLFLTEEDYRKQGAFAKMIPSLKTKKDQDALWAAIKDGTVDTIGTDHAPHTIEEKRSEKAPGGVPGEETVLPLLLDAMSKARITLERIVQLTSKNPARIFSIKGKGNIGIGYDADLTIIDMKESREVRNEDLLTKCGWSPFNSWQLKGWPVVTIVGGNVVYDHGKIYKNQGKEVIFGGWK